MKLKVFRLHKGKLELAGAREVRPDDSIIDGLTSMAEVVSLQEKSTSDFPLLFGTEPVPPTPAELAAARKSLNDKGNRALASSYKQAHPGATDKEVATFVQGNAPDPPPDSLEASLRKAHPEYTDEQIAIFKRGR